VSEPLVIVGDGMTAARLVDELTRYALARHAIGVIGDEQRLAYNAIRVLASGCSAL
jgi:nitrite reductase (NADH) large subunit